MAHNHPGMNTPEASEHDLDAVNTVGRVLTGSGVEFIGQVIVAGKEARLYSFE